MIVNTINQPVDPRGSVDFMNRMYGYSVNRYDKDIRHELQVQEDTIKRRSTSEQLAKYERLHELYMCAMEDFNRYRTYLLDRATTADHCSTQDGFIKSFDNI